MTYQLIFKREAQKEWQKLAPAIQQQLRKKLLAIREQPRIEKARLSGMADCYKIKLHSVGYRLVYQVRDQEIVIVVIAIGKRERSAVYDAARTRLT